MKVKVDIFSGFLGSGKTRLIKKLIEENYYNERIAIIENEFGEVSIDGLILRNTNTVVREINSGCICCQVTGDFKKSILEVIENYDVDRLIIEPTGVAKLSDLKKVFDEKELKETTEVERLITIVDSERYYTYLNNFRNFFVDQIKVAEIIIFSKVQMIPKGDLTKLLVDIKTLNKEAKIVSTIWDEVPARELIPMNYILESNKANSAFIRSKFMPKGMNKKTEGAGDVFQTFAFDINRNVSKDELINKFQFITNSESFGKIIRAKGIVKMSDGSSGQFDFTLDTFAIESVNYGGEGVISFIGVNLNKEEIKKFFQ